MGVRVTFFIVFLTLFMSTMYAQDKPPVHKINGKKYYLHIVEQGNTLYGISKIYNVPIGQIEMENPILTIDGLKVNQTLLIPVTKENKKELGGVIEQTEKFISHEVQQKETLYAISKQYDVSLETILKANPELKDDGLKAGSIIHIPIEQIEVEEEAHIESAEPDSLQSHAVAPGETLYSISKRYNTSVEELVKANQHLDQSLRVGMAIRIPGLRNEEYVPVKVVEDSVNTDTLVVHVPDSVSTVRIALILPLNATFPDSGETQFKIENAERVALNFFRGFRFGSDSLSKKLGLDVEINVFESGSDTTLLRKLVRGGELDSVDVIVGPFYTTQFEYIADYSGAHGIPTICPIPKPSKILFKRPNAIKMTPSESMVLNGLAGYLAENFSDSNLVLVNSNKFRDQDNIDFFKSRFAKAMSVPDTFVNDAIREIKLWDINHESLSIRFGDSGSYVLFVPSTDKVFVSKLLGELYNYQYESEGAVSFRVIGIQEWQKYDKDIDIQTIQDLKVTIPMTDYVDYNDYKVNHFVSNFYRTHGFEPDRFALIGYDVSSYILEQIDAHAEEWYKTPDDLKHDGILLDIDLQRMHDQSGLENQHFKIYQYEQFKQKKVGEWPIQKNQ